jgi:3-hydroxymyristoyl/3-hydroxydecanoyl-(acyl carrier protein) dehydratase
VTAHQSRVSPPRAGDAGEEELLEKTGDAAALEFVIPRESAYFDGHFPGAPVLSAAAQVDLALRFAARHLGTSRFVAASGRIKFPARILPGTRVRLELEVNREENSLRFKMIDPRGGRVCSAGVLFLRGPP